jgi:muramoyltetrapeptide carboxypeptidase LdcA involved in peptidoglycan recycling
MVKYTSRPPTKELKNRVHNLEELTEKVQRVNAIVLGKHPQYAKNPFYYEWYTPEMKLGEV